MRFSQIAQHGFARRLLVWGVAGILVVSGGQAAVAGRYAPRWRLPHRRWLVPTTVSTAPSTRPIPRSTSTAPATTTTTTTAAPPVRPVGCTSFVSTAGSDANPGGISAPFASISHAEAVAAPGAVVCVRGGVYRERVTLGRSGTSAARITVMAYPGEQPVIDGSGLAIGRTDALFLIDGGTNNVDVHAFTIRNSSGRGLVNGGSDNQIAFNTITNIRESGLLTTNWWTASTNNRYIANDVSYTVQANNCHTPADACAATGGWESAINQYDEGAHAAGHNIYTGNVVHDNAGEGATAMDYDTLIGNTFHDNFSFEVYLDGSQHVTVDKNLLYESEQSYLPFTQNQSYRLLAHGIGLADEGGARNSYNTVRNNMIISTRVGIAFWNASSGSGLKHDTIESNTIVNTWDTGLAFDAGSHAETVVRDNLAVPRRGSLTRGVNDVSGILSTANLFTSAGAANDPHLAGEGSFSVNPNDYRLGSASTFAIDRGVAASSADDFFGTPRPQAGGFDIGAAELKT
jgi:hypothetical protein